MNGAIEGGAAAAAPRYRLSGTLDRIAAHLPHALVSPAAFAAVRAVADELPAALTSQVYLECRLAEEPAQVDLIVAVYADEARLLRDDARALSGRLRNDAAWRHLGEFCSAWDDGNPRLAGVDHLWLEFDVDGAAGRVPVPSVGISFGELRPARFSAAQWHGHARHALAAMFPGVLPGVEEALARCFERLPAVAYVPYVGVMFPRDAAVVRLCLTGIPDTLLPDYLADAGWPGSTTDLARLLAATAAVHHPTAQGGARMVHLDVGRTLAGRVGLEYYFDRLPQLAGQLAERPLLDHLVQVGVCSRSKRAAVEQWPGYSREPLPHELRQTLLLRRLNHVKLVYEPGRAPIAKGYLHCASRTGSRRARALGAGCPRPDANGANVHGSAR